MGDRSHHADGGEKEKRKRERAPAGAGCVSGPSYLCGVCVPVLLGWSSLLAVAVWAFVVWCSGAIKI